MAARKYSSLADTKTLAAAVVSSGQSTITLNSITNLPALTTGQTFTLVINPDTTTEEIVTVTSYGSGNVLNVTRGSDSTTAQSAHAIGSVVKHMITARDLQDAQDHINAAADVHGLATAGPAGASGGNVVGTTASQTLTNKTLTSPTVNSPVVSGGTFSSPAITGGTGTLTAPTITGGTLAGSITNSATVTGGTLASPAITLSGGGSIGLGSASAPITAAGLTISAANVSHLYNSTSNIQDQLNAKLPSANIQSGKGTTSSTADAAVSTTAITFPTAFTTAPIVTVTPVRTFGSATPKVQLTVAADATTTGFSVFFTNNSGVSLALPFNWIAVGS
jgi:hypothetical protein